MKKYLSNAFWLLLDKFIRLGVTFVLMGQTAKILGAENFGVISYVQSVISVIVCVTSLGFDNILIKEFSIADEDKKNRLFNTCFFSRLVISGFSIMLVFVWLYMSNESHEIKYVYAISALAIVFQMQTIYTSLYQGLSESYTLTKINLFSFAVSCGYKIYIILTQGSLFEFCLSFVFDVGINAGFLFVYTQKNKIKLNIASFDFVLMRQLLKESLPIILSALLISIYSRLDQWMIARYLNYTDLGIYSVAIRISEAASFVPIAVSSALIPYISNEPKDDKFQMYFSTVYFISIVTALGVLVVSPFVITTIFGRDFIGSISILKYALCSMIFSVLGILSTNYLVQIKKTHLRLIRILFGLTINIALNVVLIPRYGLVGAAIASLCSQMSASWLGNCLSKNTINCFIWQAKAIFSFGVYSVLRKRLIHNKLES